MNSHEFVECEATGNTQQKSEPQALPDTTRRKISGIYGLRCRATNKWYVGQSTNILKRWNAYKWLMCKKQPKLYRALMKHGYDNFDKLVLERVDQNMDEREQYWIQYYNCIDDGYNISLGGSISPMLGRRHTKETIEKMSRIKTGKVTSEETRLKISKAQKGRKGIPWTPELRVRIMKSMAGKKKPPRTAEHCMAISAAKTGKKRKPFSDETRLRMKLAWKKRKLKTSPSC